MYIYNFIDSLSHRRNNESLLILHVNKWFKNDNVYTAIKWWVDCLNWMEVKSAAWIYMATTLGNHYKSHITILSSNISSSPFIIAHYLTRTLNITSLHIIRRSCPNRWYDDSLNYLWIDLILQNIVWRFEITLFIGHAWNFLSTYEIVSNVVDATQLDILFLYFTLIVLHYCTVIA